MVITFIDQGSNVMLKITAYIMEFSPIGIMSLMATMVSTVSGAMLKDVIVFILLDCLTCLAVLIVAYPLIIQLLAKLNAVKFFRKIVPAIIVAVSTTSSTATLPVSIRCAEDDLCVPENIYGFTLHLGNTCGMSGFAVFIGLCCVWASNLYGHFGTGPVYPEELNPKNELYIEWSPEFCQWHNTWWDPSIPPYLFLDSVPLMRGFFAQPQFWAICPETVVRALKEEIDIETLPLTNPPPDRITYLVTPKVPNPGDKRNLDAFCRLLDDYCSEAFKDKGLLYR